MNERIDPEEQKKMVDKLQKLLALATSPNENEAVLAMDKAAELMEKYSLSMADIAENGKTQSEKIKENLVREDIPGLGTRRALWESILANGISKAFDVKLVSRPYATYDKDFNKVDWSLCFMGFKADVEISIWLHKYLRRTISRKSTTTYTSKNDRNNFAHGMVNSINKRLQEMYTKRNVISDCKALVVVKDKAVSAFSKEQFPKLQSGGKINLTGNRSAYVHGISEGEKVSLSRPLNGSSTNQKKLN